MTRIQKQIRQGDVLLNPIATIPASAVLAKTTKRVVLAEGEVTGHAHAIDYKPKQMKVFTDGQQLYLRVNSPVVLRHEEHAPATVEPGDYIVVRQTEVWLDEVRQVAD